MRYSTVLAGVRTLALPFVRALAVETRDTAAVVYSTDDLVEVQPAPATAILAGYKGTLCAWGFTETGLHGALVQMTSNEYTVIVRGIASISLAPDYRFQATR
jgi:hypothetical protein